MDNLENQRQEAVAERILVFIPAYNCSKQITRVTARFDGVERYFAEVLVVDNRSSDNTLEAAHEAAVRAKLPVTIVRNKDNYGFGGSHKLAFGYAVDHGFDYCVVLHGDDQGSIRDLVPHLEAGTRREVGLPAWRAFYARRQAGRLFRLPDFRQPRLQPALLGRRRPAALRPRLGAQPVPGEPTSYRTYHGFANNFT